jgi:uncharacterized protein with GYD domain
MPKYLIKASYTAEGVKGVMKDGGTKRRQAAEAAVKSTGGRLEGFYFAFGEADALVIIDAPDNASVAAASMAIGASGSSAARRWFCLLRRDRPGCEEGRDLYSAWTVNEARAYLRTNSHAGRPRTIVPPAAPVLRAARTVRLPACSSRRFDAVGDGMAEARRDRDRPEIHGGRALFNDFHVSVAYSMRRSNCFRSDSICSIRS